MEKEQLIALKKKINELSEKEGNLRNLYLRDLANGTIAGPPVGYLSIDKPWLKYYSKKAILSEIPKFTAYEYLLLSGLENIDSIALTYFGKKYTYKQLLVGINEVADRLYEIGVRKGDIVTIAIPNIPENVFLFYALNLLGAVANLVDLRMKDEMLLSAINEVDSKIMIGCDLFIDNIASVIDKTKLKKVIVTSPADSLPVGIKQLYNMKNKKMLPNDKRFISWDNFIKNKPFEPGVCLPEVDKDSPACILHTSGTTGVSKGVVITNEALNTMAIQYKYLNTKYSVGERFMNQVPPFLAYNIILSTHMPLCLGLNIIMFPNYEPEKFAENIMKYKISHVAAGPADWSNFLENEKVKRHDMSHLVTMGCGSDKINPERKKQINELIQSRGGDYSILEGYGMTEVGSAACSNLPNIDVENSLGVPLCKMTIAIFDEFENELSNNKTGEICITGPTMMKEYYKNESETNMTMKKHADGKMWIHSGDLGHMTDDGVLFYEGRMKRLIVRYDGIKISPNDIEKAIRELPFVDDCCVVGIDDLVHGSGTVPCPFVIVKDGFDKSDEELKKEVLLHCREKLTEKYCLGDIEIIDEFPLTQVGKVDYLKLAKKR